MTMIESPTEAVAEPRAPKSNGFRGILATISTSDHKRIGRLWIHVSVLLFAGVAVLGVALGVERLNTETVDVFGGSNSYFQMWGL